MYCATMSVRSRLDLLCGPCVLSCELQVHTYVPIPITAMYVLRHNQYLFPFEYKAFGFAPWSKTNSTHSFSFELQRRIDVQIIHTSYTRTVLPFTWPSLQQFQHNLVQFVRVKEKFLLSQPTKRLFVTMAYSSNMCSMFL